MLSSVRQVSHLSHIYDGKYEMLNCGWSTERRGLEVAFQDMRLHRIPRKKFAHARGFGQSDPRGRRALERH